MTKDADDPKVAKVEVPLEGRKTREQMLAELGMGTFSRNALSAQAFASPHCGGGIEYSETMQIVAKMCAKVRSGNLEDLTDMLTAQALTLDSMFTEYSRRAAINMGQYPDAVDRYTNLAAKAQSQCRTTIETLARVKRGGKQTVTVVHVNDGGQAIVADTFNNGAAGGSGAGINDQCHATRPRENTPRKTGPAGGTQPTAPTGASAALPSPDPLGSGVPIPSRERPEKVPNARRDESRST
jgi:hypothetical protein